MHPTRDFVDVPQVAVFAFILFTPVAYDNELTSVLSDLRQALPTKNVPFILHSS